MTDDLLSIIVPVYNVQDYLEQCVSSICNQTYKNLEIILVNDGSTDNSASICEKFAEMDSRIKLISQENQGVVRARKKGVNLARGTYIGFVDADDYIDRDMYQQLMDCKDDFDLVISRWYREENSNVRQACDKIELGAYRTEDEINYLLDHLVSVATPGGEQIIRPGLTPYMWVKLYQTSKVKDIMETVNEKISIGEDFDFFYRYVLQCKSVLITDICGYHYRVRQKSAAHSVSQDCTYIKNICMLYETLLPVFCNHPRHDSLVPQLQFKFSAMLKKAPAKMGFPPEAQIR